MSAPTMVRRAFTGRLVGLPPDAPEDNPSPPEPVPSQKSKAALRAERWRKKQGDAFREEERKRKETERAEENRQNQIEEIRATSFPPLTVVNEMGKEVRLSTGGKDGVKIEQIAAAATKKVTGRRVEPKGAGFQKFTDSERDTDFPDQGREETFVEKAFGRHPKDVRAMRGFIFQNIRAVPPPAKNIPSLKVCLSCDAPLTTDSNELMHIAFNHIHDQHPELFRVLLARLGQKTKVCPEDHAGIVARHAGGEFKVQCRRCKKVLWKPEKRRSDKPGDASV